MIEKETRDPMSTTCRCDQPNIETENGVRYCIDCGRELESPQRRQVDALAARIAEEVAARIPTTPEVEPWVDVGGAAEHLHCKPQRIYDLTSRAETSGIPFTKEGSRLLFRRSQLDAWVGRNGR